VTAKSRITDADTQRRVQREVDAVWSLTHPHIASFFDFFSDDTSYYLVTESSAAGTVDDFLQKRRRVPERDAAYICLQLISALVYCHSRSVFHRNVRPSSVLVTQFPKVKLCDFGSCVFAPRYSGPPPPSLCRAPEEAVGGSYSAERADVWALGACVYQMVIGSAPIEFWRIGAANWADTLPDDISEPCRDVIRATMHPMPGRRASLAEMLDMTWLKAGIPRTIGDARALVEAMRQTGPKLSDRPVPKPKILEDGSECPIERVIIAPDGEYPRILKRVIVPALKRPGTVMAIRKGQIPRPAHIARAATLR
jgi:serine/threonine protein kinase